MAALGLIGIGRSFGYDEGFTYAFFINEGSVRRALTTQIVFNNHPMFSAIQSVGWRVGLTGETAQRLGPLLCGAVTAGIVVTYTARRVGVIGGLAAGAVLSLNLVFLESVRQLRGYALATMAVLLAAIAVQRSWHDSRTRWLVAQGVLMVVAVTTHAYSAVPILMVAAASLALGHVERRHLITWLSAAGSAAVIMWPLIDDIRANARARGRSFYETFPQDLVEALTGRVWPAVLITSVAVVVGMIDLGRRSRRHAWALAAGSGVLLAVVLLIWLVLQPRDLYLRFFVSVLPFVAILVGRGIARVPRSLGIVASLVLVVSLAPPVADAVKAEPTIRDAAAVVDRARALGLDVCGRNAEPLLVYTPPVRPVAGLDDFDACRVYVSVLGMSAAQRAAASDHFAANVPLGGGVVIWADESVLDELVVDL